ncbi:hypothetical protein WCT87_07150 [Pectobacterium brasiliense]|uniref:hypothetical protein n=1 Tax=Pectobacterium brasiliense TaxID=180957 RepID=UPI003016C374
MIKLQVGDTIILNDGDKGIVNFANETGYEVTMESSGKYHHLLPDGRAVNPHGERLATDLLSINWNYTKNKESFETVKYYEELRKQGHEFTPDELYDWDAHHRVLEGQ